MYVNAAIQIYLPFRLIHAFLIKNNDENLNVHNLSGFILVCHGNGFLFFCSDLMAVLFYKHKL